MSSPTVLTLIRHGQTSANQGGVWHGSIDTPLSDVGHDQARRVARYLADELGDARAIYSSPLTRTRDTASAIAEALALEIRLEAGLREYDLGSWEGETYAALYEERRLWHHMKTDPHFAPHGGESPIQVADRFTGALRAIAASHPGERVIVVTHGGALSMGIAAIVEGDYTKWGRVMDNCAVSELVLEPQPAMLRFNFTDHLET